MSTPLQNKLFNYSAQPPEGAWENIAASLAEGEAPLARRLQNFEAQPSSDLWKHIEKRLPAKFSSIFIRYKKPLAFAAAAAVLAAIVFTGVLINQPGKNTGQAATVPLPKTQVTTAPKQDTPSVQYFEDQPQYAINNNNKINWQRSNANEPEFAANPLPVQHTATLNVGEGFIPTHAMPMQTVDAPPEKYMVYSDEEGNATRLSKKVFDFFSCAQQRPDCRQQMQQLQQQFATTSATDFAGLVELLKKLNENH